MLFNWFVLDSIQLPMKKLWIFKILKNLANADCIDINDSLYYFDNTPALTPCYNELVI